VSRPRIVACEERVLAVQRDGRNGASDRVAIQFDAAVGQEQCQPAPVFGDEFQRFSEWRLGGDTGPVVGDPGLESVDDWL